MKKLTSPIELQKLQEELAKKHQKDSSQIVVCGGTGCRAYGCEDVYNAFKNALEQQKAKASGEQIGLKLTGCHGFCECGTLVVIHPERILYVRVNTEGCPGNSL